MKGTPMDCNCEFNHAIDMGDEECLWCGRIGTPYDQWDRENQCVIGVK